MFTALTIPFCRAADDLGHRLPLGRSGLSKAVRCLNSPNSADEGEGPTHTHTHKQTHTFTHADTHTNTDPHKDRTKFPHTHKSKRRDPAPPRLAAHSPLLPLWLP